MERPNMRLIPTLPVVVAALLLLPPSAPAQLPGMPATPRQTPPPAETGARPKPEEIRKRLADARAELARIEAPGGLAAGAPAGVPEGDLITRRFLLQQLVRGYEGQLSEIAGAINAEQ